MRDGKRYRKRDKEREIERDIEINILHSYKCQTFFVSVCVPASQTFIRSI